MLSIKYILAKVLSCKHEKILIGRHSLLAPHVLHVSYNTREKGSFSLDEDLLC